eukprot:Trichotokara_eunicae@DN6360_c0_g2_i4.p1
MGGGNSRRKGKLKTAEEMNSEDWLDVFYSLTTPRKWEGVHLQNPRHCEEEKYTGHINHPPVAPYGVIRSLIDIWWLEKGIKCPVRRPNRIYCPHYRCINMFKHCAEVATHEPGDPRPYDEKKAVDYKLHLCHAPDRSRNHGGYVDTNDFVAYDIRSPSRIAPRERQNVFIFQQLPYPTEEYYLDFAFLWPAHEEEKESFTAIWDDFRTQNQDEIRRIFGEEDGFEVL